MRCKYFEDEFCMKDHKRCLVAPGGDCAKRGQSPQTKIAQVNGGEKCGLCESSNLLKSLSRFKRCKDCGGIKSPAGWYAEASASEMGVEFLTVLLGLCKTFKPRFSFTLDGLQISISGKVIFQGYMIHPYEELKSALAILKGRV